MKLYGLTKLQNDYILHILRYSDTVSNGIQWTNLLAVQNYFIIVVKSAIMDFLEKSRLNLVSNMAHDV